MNVYINPGSGPVEGAMEEDAIENMKKFIEDTGTEHLNCLRIPEEDAEGRFGFLLWKGTRCHFVDMPGLPLSQVRYMDENGQDIWDYPRLYIDGSSWVWKFAITYCTEDRFKEPVYEDE